MTGGYKFEPDAKCLIYDPEYDIIHKDMSEYQYSSMVLRDIMNSIVYNMTFTSEDQTQFDDKFLPTLDFKLKLVTKGIPRLQYEFFKKPVSSKLAILKTSALPET